MNPQPRRSGGVTQRSSHSDRLEADAVDSDADRDVGQLPVALPVIKGGRWFGSEPRPLVLRVELPLTCEEMVAALYGIVQADEITTREELCGCVAVTLLLEGLPALQERAARLRASELRAGVASPEFLDSCRRRVAGLLAA
jgi:hypothetical protein